MQAVYLATGTTWLKLQQISRLRHSRSVLLAEEPTLISAEMQCTYGWDLERLAVRVRTAVGRKRISEWNKDKTVRKSLLTPIKDLAQSNPS